jgi:hypothetical protein
MNTPARIVFSLAAALLIHQAVHADQPAEPGPWMKTSAYGNYLFKMVPEKYHWVESKTTQPQKVVDREAFGVAYQIDKDGELKEIWRTEGWYVFDGDLSHDGRYFVGHGPWAEDWENLTDLAIAFYDRGKLLKEYRVKDLIKNRDTLVQSSSHYWWKPEKQTKPNGFVAWPAVNTFHLVTVDKTTYKFDVTTGSIIETDTDPAARSYRELLQEEAAAAASRGKELYETAAFRATYDEKFTVGDISAGQGKIYGVHFTDPEWKSDLTPTKTYAISCLVEAVFPIKDGKAVDAQVTPDEIDIAFQKILSHPLVTQNLEKGVVSRARLRITGDRLHWDSQELREWLANIEGNALGKNDTLRKWAEVVLDTVGNRGFVSFFLNTASGELLQEDEATWPRQLVLLDAGGQVRTRWVPKPK